MAEPKPSFKFLPIGVPSTIMYTNWKGEKRQRQIKPINLWYGSTEFHPEPQMLLLALDVEKNQLRDFAVKDIEPVYWDK
ncbi:hypothetical protein [Herbiconiux daphne]|uniref:Uncharacterized protein n=1 Tax=Herbiconiux daphne TaxID=2970914 RepID=A0ABT2HCD7_9MICO|nr:hypothetical protein [Herbiconiux daphne]MCS5737517.1 hypothetical protein [Herbiconiux daphne]